MTRFLPNLAVLAILSSIALAGCKLGAVQEVHQAALEKENRELEDQIYYLEDVISGFEMRLDSAQRENAALKSTISADGATTPAPPATRDSVAPRTGTGAPPADNGLRPPRIELGPESPLEPGDEGPNVPTPGPQGANGSSPGGTGASSGVARIVINRWLSGGVDTDGRDGHEGVLAVVEPRDAQGQLIHAPAEMTLTVVDPAETGAAARVATWKFTTDEAAARFRVHPPGAGIHLQMPWPNEPPHHRQLKLEVRYQAPDGRVLVAEHPMRIVPPADHSLIVKSEGLQSDAPKISMQARAEVESPDKGIPPARTANQNGRPRWSPNRH
jgi:hypothetical protein